MDPAKAAEFGWQEFDPKKWQDLPDGSICIMDECQNEFPLRRSGSEVPDYINAIAQFRRKRGFDFWMICPHPSLLDVFVRRLIDKPSWHRHLKRAFGADVVSVLTFSSPDMKCEEPGAGARGEVAMRPYPKDVYSWYKSASLHTGKKKIPRAVWIVAACAVAVPSAIWFAVSGVYGNVAKKKQGAEAVVKGGTAPAVAGPAAREVPLAKVSADDYLTLRKPRLSDFPHTAPAYDQVTMPVQAPYPAACVQMAKVCKCYTQQGTLLQVSGEVCLQIVKHGFFVDWQQAQGSAFAQNPPSRPTPHSTPAPVQAAPIVNVHLPANQSQQPTPGSEWSQGLAARNADVRSMLTR
jgi:zona occludens toxin